MGGLFSIFLRKSASKAQKTCDFAYFTSQWGGSSPPAPPPGYATALIEIGAKHGAVNATDIMPSRFTVKREVTKRAKKEKCNISKCLIKSIDAHGMIGITTDMWTDIKNRHFMSITCHYFEDGKLKSAATHVAKFDEKKTW